MRETIDSLYYQSVDWRSWQVYYLAPDISQSDQIISNVVQLCKSALNMAPQLYQRWSDSESDDVDLDYLSSSHDDTDEFIVK